MTAIRSPARHENRGEHRQGATLAARLEAAAPRGIDEWPAVRSVAEDIEAAMATVAAMVTTQTSVQ